MRNTGFEPASRSPRNGVSRTVSDGSNPSQRISSPLRLVVFGYLGDDRTMPPEGHNVGSTHDTHTAPRLEQPEGSQDTSDRDTTRRDSGGYTVEKVDGIPLVCKANCERLGERQLQDYKAYKRVFIHWLLNLAKDPDKAKDMLTRGRDKQPTRQTHSTDGSGIAAGGIRPRSLPRMPMST
jgi:hypothetical protein